MKTVVRFVVQLVTFVQFILTINADCTNSPTTPDNSIVKTPVASRTAFPIKSNFTYICLDGYQLTNGTSVITISCLGTTWSEPDSVCTPITCRITPLDFANSYVVTAGSNINMTEIFTVASLSNETSLPYNSTIVYACIENYTFSQSVRLLSATCMSDLSITDINDECTPIPCIANFSQLVNYSSQILSMTDANDSIIQVGPFSEFFNYSIFPVNTAIEYTCPKDTIPSSVNNSAIGICILSGQWTIDTNLTCTPILCSEIPPFVNFTINNKANFTQRRIGGIFTYTCDFYAKFDSFNGASVTCQQINATSGQWIITQGSVKCIPATCAATTQYNSTVAPNPASQPYTHGDNATFTCNENMALLNSTINSYVLTCYNGRWQPDGKRCYENVCFPPVPPPNTVVDGVVIMINSTAMEANLYNNYTSYTVNSTIHYVCKQGFVNDSSSTTYFSTCNLGQSWLLSDLVCRPPPCTNIPYINNSNSNVTMLTPKGSFTVSLNNTLSTLDVNNMLIYKCNNGYGFTPSNVFNLTCMFGEVGSYLSTDVPNCQLMNCSSFPAVNNTVQKQVTRLMNGSIVVVSNSPNLNSYEVNSLIEYNCRSMYRIKGNYSQMLTQCNIGPYWSNNVVGNHSCEPIPCDISNISVANSKSSLIIPLENGTIQSSNGSKNSELPVNDGWLIFECMNGYRLKLNSNARVTCSLGPVLSSLPECQKIPCPKFKVLNNSDVFINNTVINTLQSEYSVDTVVSFRCKTGFRLNVAASSMTCQFGGNWSYFNDSASCDAMSCTDGINVNNTSVLKIVDNYKNIYFESSVNMTEVSVGTTLSYSCLSAYMSSNSSMSSQMVTCVSGPRFEPSINFSCIPKPCAFSKLNKLNAVITNVSILFDNGTYLNVSNYGKNDNFPFGAILYLKCKSEYEYPETNNFIQSRCVLSPKWNTEVGGNCVAKPCPLPLNLTINNTQMFLSDESASEKTRLCDCSTKSNLTLNEKLIYKCNDGFQPKIGFDQAIASCSLGPNFTNANLICEPKPCSSPPGFPNAIPKITLINLLNQTLLDNQYGAGSVVIYQCNNKSQQQSPLVDGFYNMTCQSNGNWKMSSTNITCTAFTCNQPFPSVNNAALNTTSPNSKTSYEFGEVIMYACNTGMNFISGSNMFECAWDEANSKAIWRIFPSSSGPMICSSKSNVI